MKLPNAENSRVEPAKITGYLLADEHPKGGSKARFLVKFGFNRAQWQVLERALLAQAANHDVTAIDETQHGLMYVINGAIETPDGRNPQIRTVWIIRYGDDSPRFVRARPLGR